MAARHRRRPGLSVVVLLLACCAPQVLAAAPPEEAPPGRELLEFLAEWSSGGEWIDPLALEAVPIPPVERDVSDDADDTDDEHAPENQRPAPPADH